MRNATVSRSTAESQIQLVLELEGSGAAKLQSPVPFLDHMLHQLARHGGFDIELQATGDVETGAHHTVEDIGICLGTALDRALGDRRGIERYGSAFCPLDEALAQVVVDLGGRPFFVLDPPFPNVQIGNFNADLTYDFFQALATHARATVHVRILYGRNEHHKIEAAFKAFALALRQAVGIRAHDRERVPSTKEHLD